LAVTVKVWMNTAVTDRFAVILMLAGFVVPVTSPLQ
jgi:hypothetical protein